MKCAIAPDTPGAMAQSGRGMTTVNVVPSLSVESTRISPPWALAISLTMNNPSPTLRPTDATSVPRTIGWNNVGCSAAGMTDPWLCTAIENRPGRDREQSDERREYGRDVVADF